MLNENITNHLLRCFSQEIISAGGSLLWLLLELATLLLESFIILQHFYLAASLFGNFLSVAQSRPLFRLFIAKLFFLQ